jgi:SNF family Na+-dependent transporter
MAKQERWASRLGLVLAMAGNAVGLGNFLRFPAQAAQNGGGAFLIPYFVALLLLGLPLIWVEWAMGRYGGQRGHHSTPGIFDVMGNRRPWWKYLAVFGLFTNLLVAAYYLYIESWTLTYAIHSLMGGFRGMDVKGVRDFFEWMTGETEMEIMAISPVGLSVFAICIVINIWILSRGLARGIELVSKVGMPLLILFAAVLAVRGLMIHPESDPAAKTSPLVGLNYVWEPKFDSLSNPSVWLAAAGQIFFTLSIGMGSIHCYASYLREKDDVALTGASAAWTNEFCEVILGGTILIPIATAYLTLDGVRDKSGFSLGFFVFPTLFDKWGAFAPVAGFLWFGLLFFAAITSSLAMGQPIMAFLQQEYKLTRPQSALGFGALLLPLAIPVAVFTQATFFEEFDYWVGTFSLVVFAFIESILFAWVFGMQRGWEEINKGSEIRVPKVFRFVIQFITPVFLLIILLSFALKPEGKGPDGTVRGWEPYVRAVFTGELFGRAPAEADAPPRDPLPEWEWAGDSLIGKLLHYDLRKECAAKLKQTANPSAREKVQAYFDQLMFWRDVDRLVMLAAYAFFAGMVWGAWARRAEGERAQA